MYGSADTEVADVSRASTQQSSPPVSSFMGSSLESNGNYQDFTERFWIKTPMFGLV